MVLAYTGHGATKKAAEIAAAACALGELDLSTRPRSRPAATSHNPISALQELCQAERTEMPRYSFVESAISGRPTFECTVRLSAGGGQTVVCTAAASSRQRAKRLAARAALLALCGPEQ